MTEILDEKKQIIALAHMYWERHADATTEEVIDHVAAELRLERGRDELEAVRSILAADSTSDNPRAERRYDDSVEQSFPASDPPTSP